MEQESSNVTNVTENVEETTEETQEMLEGAEELTETGKEETKGTYYTDEELDKRFADRYNRGRAKGEKTIERKYSGIVNILKQGLGVNEIDEIEDKLSEFYQSEGIQLTKNSEYDDDDLNYLAQRDAEEIISDGMMETELQRLADKGTEKMTKREKAMFKTLHEAHTKEKSKKELAEIGVGADVLESKEFKDFAKKLNPNLSAKEKYEMYEKIKPKENKEQMGSMSSNSAPDKGIKEFYTYDEAIKFSADDFRKNPKLQEAVEKSMSKW